jgi:hypothetical protein
VAFERRRNCTRTSLLVNIARPSTMRGQSTDNALTVILFNSTFAIIAPSVLFVIFRESGAEKFGREVFAFAHITLQIQLLTHVVALPVV